MRVLAFTGLPGSGKSEAIAAVRKLGVPVVRMGDFVLAEVRSRGLAETEEHIGPVATGMRESHGADVWARRTLDALQDGDVAGVAGVTPLVVIDGVRSPAEIEAFRQRLGKDFVLVAVEAPAAVRHKRILGRGRVDDAQDLELVKARDQREKGWGLDDAIRQADHRIQNEGDLEELRGHIHELLEELAPGAA
jgi:dephospho-CoA kinase